MYPEPYNSLPPLGLGLWLLTSLMVLVPLCSSTHLDIREQGAPKLTVYSNYFDPTPSPEDGPPLSAGALRNPAFLPAQIGAIVGSYALSLVAVAAILLCLAKIRRDHLLAGEEGLDSYEDYGFKFSLPAGLDPSGNSLGYPYPYPSETPKSAIHTFSYPTSTPGDPNQPYTLSGSFSTYSTSTLGINPLVDQRVVAADREMAQQQLEQMYKYVLEHEAAKEAGTPIEAPPTPLLKQPPSATSPKPSILKKGKTKPSSLDLSSSEPERQSRGSSFLSALRSPRKKKTAKGTNISSPIMTPMSGTFPHQEAEEMSVISPRHYAPPPPMPTHQPAHWQSSRNQGSVATITPPDMPPDMSPESTQTIDERLGAQFGHLRVDSRGPTEVDPVSATSERSTTPLIGLPSSPRPTSTRFATLPGSPRPSNISPTSPRSTTSFSRSNAPSAVRTGGALPLRAYEAPLSSPSVQTTKQTTFERKMPMSPGMNTPWTGAPVPYSPYQPFSPVVPVTPSLVTKADRKRMRQQQPKTPTVNMVQSSEDIW
ncbi:hypothetical protein GGR50DRAFT_384403 [Xylaria sp. CBS 124048]|nr:hypothetical protein GGR50DRAFT_384403 [Xylaria sp. CBS 124048]